jgi:phosphomevalonate kinase
MRVIAPGKLVLTGAYAVLRGAPAIVVAVDRYAVADTESPSVVDVHALHDGEGRKLGLGSSAATIVASLGSRAVARGEDPRHPPVRAEIFRIARETHAREQGGGSGVDVAASVFGGMLCYEIAGKSPRIKIVEPPSALVMEAYWSGTSARTSDLRARVDKLHARAPRSATFTTLRDVAEQAAASAQQGDARGFVERAAAFGRALGALGQAADAPIVPPGFAELAQLAEEEQGAFLPSGAGGGDVAVWLGCASPSAEFERRAVALSIRHLPLSVDRGGVRPEALS